MRVSCAATRAAPPARACARRRCVRGAVAAQSPQSPPPCFEGGVPRRAALLLPSLLACAPPARAQSTLWERLERRQLDKPVFNLAPSQQLYPDWLAGTWDAETSFAGYAFPSTKIDKACVARAPRARLP